MDVRTAVVIDEDAATRRLVAEVLGHSGLTVHGASRGAAGAELVTRHDPFVTTLELDLPDIDGLEVIRRIRQSSWTHVIVITGRAAEVDVLQALDAGADEVLGKPLQPRLLRARVDAIRRRAEYAPRLGAGGPGVSNEVLRHRGLELFPASRLVRVDGVPVDLSRSQFDILLHLLRAGARVVSKAELSRVLQEGRTLGPAAPHGGHAVEVHVANLRRRLGDSARRPRWIETVRAVGYRLARASERGGAAPQGRTHTIPLSVADVSPARASTGSPPPLSETRWRSV
ncbi:response regulator transcription factor [Microbacterium album]|uniref:response regulator transcription factor n=1 Tax=Microbacterium album TaxID=2053191 RepID=UPI001666E06C|nr:response regulator transcription factor [Microbacterium album]